MPAWFYSLRLGKRAEASRGRSGPDRKRPLRRTAVRERHHPPYFSEYSRMTLAETLTSPLTMAVRLAPVSLAS